MYYFNCKDQFKAKLNKLDEQQRSASLQSLFVVICEVYVRCLWQEKSFQHFVKQKKWLKDHKANIS